MEIAYLTAPVVGYLAAGSLKFAINSLKFRKLAVKEIGMGGIPSTHNTITSTSFFSIAFGEGFMSPVSAVAFTVCIIVAIDSVDLRRKLEDHATLLSLELGDVNNLAKNLRTKLGHRPLEVLAGWCLGAVCAVVLHNFLPLFST